MMLSNALNEAGSASCSNSFELSTHDRVGDRDSSHATSAQLGQLQLEYCYRPQLDGRAAISMESKWLLAYNFAIRLISDRDYCVPRMPIRLSFDSDTAVPESNHTVTYVYDPDGRLVTVIRPND